jgi:DNA-binding NtrC family response regulator
MNASPARLKPDKHETNTKPLAHGLLPLSQMPVRTISILILDDDEESRTELTLQLIEQHCVVKTCSGAMEAESLLSTESFDVLLANPQLLMQSESIPLKSTKTREPAPLYIALGDFIEDGSFDCLPRQATVESLRALLRRTRVVVDLRNEIRNLNRVLRPSLGMKTIQALERAHIENVLAIADNQDQAAEILGITTVTLWRKRKLYKLP